MTVRLTEQRLGQLRWLVAEGPARDAFTALGECLRAEVRDIVAGWSDLARLRGQVAQPPGSERLRVVAGATRTRFPGGWDELAALADGAGVPASDLLLMNLRGDLGVLEDDQDGIGCSDISWRRQRSLIAHNEDESSYFEGRCLLLTLLLDGEQPVTAYCKPGFLPSTAFTVTGSGLAWHTNHGRYVTGADAGPADTSQTRADVLDRLQPPDAEPDPDWFLRILVGAPPPDGVRAEPGGDSSAMTMCTFVADLSGGEATIAARDAEPVTIKLAELAHGHLPSQQAGAS